MCLLLNTLRRTWSPQSFVATWLAGRRSTNVCLHWRILKDLLLHPAGCLFELHWSWAARTFATLGIWAPENIYAYNNFTCSTKARVNVVRVISSNKIVWVLRSNQIVYYNFSQSSDGNNSTASGDHCFCCALASKYPHAASGCLKKYHTRESAGFLISANFNLWFTVLEGY